jgi:hypothetical protein
MFRIVLEKPVSGVEYGIQKGKGKNYETVQKQMAQSSDLTFEIPVSVKLDEKNNPVFLGPFAQGTPLDRFIYVDIGTYAGQKNTPWSRKLKIPLTGISKTLINKISAQQVLVTKVPGTGKDGGPSCATVKPFEGWKFLQ